MNIKYNLEYNELIKQNNEFICNTINNQLNNSYNNLKNII